MYDVHPISTLYDGHFFRSRLEARWACFFNRLKIPYRYEIEGYALGKSWYLPDFYLPEQDYWIEIKGFKPTDEEQLCLSTLATKTKTTAFIFFGDIPTKIEATGPKRLDVNASAWLIATNGEYSWDCDYTWCECPKCGKLEIQYDARADRIHCPCNKSIHGDKGYNGNSPNLLEAYLCASSARFEDPDYIP